MYSPPKAAVARGWALDGLVTLSRNSRLRPAVCEHESELRECTTGEAPRMGEQRAMRTAATCALRRTRARRNPRRQWTSLVGAAIIIVALAFSACSTTTTTTTSAPRAVTPPAGWVQINAKGHFTFWMPSALVLDEQIQGTDSYVRQWSGAGLYVKFDYGMYSGGIDSRIQDMPHTKVSDSASGRAGTIVTYTENGVKIATLYVRQVNEQDRLTFTAGSLSEGTLEIPLTIVRSVRFL